MVHQLHVQVHPSQDFETLKLGQSLPAMFQLHRVRQALDTFQHGIRLGQCTFGALNQVEPLHDSANVPPMGRVVGACRGDPRNVFSNWPILIGFKFDALVTKHPTLDDGALLVRKTTSALAAFVPIGELRQRMRSECSIAEETGDRGGSGHRPGALELSPDPKPTPISFANKIPPEESR